MEALLHCLDTTCRLNCIHGATGLPRCSCCLAPALIRMPRLFQAQLVPMLQMRLDVSAGCLHHDTRTLRRRLAVGRRQPSPCGRMSPSHTKQMAQSHLPSAIAEAMAAARVVAVCGTKCIDTALPAQYRTGRSEQRSSTGSSHTDSLSKLYFTGSEGCCTPLPNDLVDSLCRRKHRRGWSVLYKHGKQITQANYPYDNSLQVC